MRIDSHVHFWRYEADGYPWISADMQGLRRDRMPPAVRAALDRKKVDFCVAVQARMTEHETDFLLSLASEYPWIGAVIGWVDLCDPDLVKLLQRWRDNKTLTGFRHVLQNDSAAAALVASDEFRRGVRLLQSRAMLYELLVSADQLSFVHDFCGSLDRHWLVLDHLGKPAIRERALGPWLLEMTRLARLPHVVCKVSGLVTEANDAHGGVDERHLTEYLDATLTLFGPQRMMFGSDWPVCTLVSSYEETVDIVERWALSLSATDREWIWGKTAARVYGIQ